MFNEYLKNIAEKYKTGDFLEHTFRTDFENLLNGFLKDEIKVNIQVIHEPQREKFGAPDFKIIDKANNIIGYIECKNITEDIKGLVNSPQIKKYLEISNNLIFTNYIDFILFKNGEVLNHCSIASILDFKGKPKVNNENQIKDLLRKFFLTIPELTTSTKKLSLELAKRTRILHDFILEEMTSPYIPLDKGDIGGEAGHYFKVYKTFKTMVPELPVDNFVDMYSQIMSFGLLFFRLSKDLILTRENILSNIPHYIPLLKDVFHNARFDKWSGNTLWILDEILLLLNNVDVKIIKESLSYKTLSLLNKREDNLSDPFLFFYEEFLKVYDKKTKVSRGVFYTPESVVSFIVRSLDIILKEKLDIKKGFLDSSIKILDFATGTGTFILALIEYIKEELRNTNNYGLFNTEVNEFILENIYGFELLVVPYIICHLRIHEYLESFGFHYKGDIKERAEIYLTNTLENNTNILLTNYFDDIDKEAQLAHNVKNNENILVIMGNPPYSGVSSNNGEWISNLIDSYKYVDGEYFNEKKHWLNDDYVKFIRFAQWKLEKVNKGVIGIITNHAFIDNPTFRGMRNSLLNSFEEIYIFNLHGNSNIGESCPDGSKDENVFDIKQGVCISFFVKTGKKNKTPNINYFSLQGKRDIKYNFLYEKNINYVNWEKLSPEKPFYLFNPQDNILKNKYNKFIRINDILNKNVTGLVSARDSLVIDLIKDKLVKRINEFSNASNSKSFITDKYKLKDTRGWKIDIAIEKMSKLIDKESFYKIMMYRPFDSRFIFYNKDMVDWGRWDLLPQITTNNIGIISMREFSYGVPDYCYTFITNSLIDNRTFVSNKGTCYLFPLYIFPDSDSLDQERKPNFTDSFTDFLKQKKLSDKTPEAILGYIYSILYSPTYRTKYYEFLKIDFPRIPFCEDKGIFGDLSELGQRLIDLHLLKVEFDKNIVSFPVSKPDLNVTKVEYKNNQVWFNDTTYFDNVPQNVWDYYIGGYQVLDKWLKERKKHNYTLCGEDLRHFIKVCNVLAETIEIQGKIDELTRRWV